jgi:hypothetical protein
MGFLRRAAILFFLTSALGCGLRYDPLTRQWHRVPSGDDTPTPPPSPSAPSYSSTAEMDEMRCESEGPPSGQRADGEKCSWAGECAAVLCPSRDDFTEAWYAASCVQGVCLSRDACSRTELNASAFCFRIPDFPDAGPAADAANDARR